MTTDPLDIARVLVATPVAERGPVHQDLVRAIRYDGPDVPPGRACLWLLPDGTTTGILRDAVRAWRIAAGGPTVGRPRTRTEAEPRPRRTGVRVQLYLSPETAAWLRSQPGGQSAAVERWAEEMRARSDVSGWLGPSDHVADALPYYRAAGAATKPLRAAKE